MATQDDQPRPDLDAALDAVLPTLSAVGDERTAASLRRTRLALADQRGRLRSGWTASPWRWALPAAVALTVALIAVSAWLSRTPGGDGPRVVVTVPSPTSAPLSPAPSTAAPSVPAPRQVEPPRVDARRVPRALRRLRRPRLPRRDRGRIRCSRWCAPSKQIPEIGVGCRPWHEPPRPSASPNCPSPPSSWRRSSRHRSRMQSPAPPRPRRTVMSVLRALCRPARSCPRCWPSPEVRAPRSHGLRTPPVDSTPPAAHDGKVTLESERADRRDGHPQGRRDKPLTKTLSMVAADGRQDQGAGRHARCPS